MPATEHFFRNQKTLHVVFAVSCVVLLVSVIGMMVEDYADEWRGIQSTNLELQALTKQRDIAEMEQEADFLEQQAELEAKLQANEEALEPFTELQAQVADELDTATRLADALKLKLKSEGANRDEARANYDLAIRDNLSAEVLAERREKFEEAQAVCDAIQLELEQAQANLKNVGTSASTEDAELGERLDKLAELEAENEQLKKDLEKLQADITLAESALIKIRPEAPFMKLKRRMMELPIIEGFNGHLKVVQDWLPDLHQTLGMTQIARFDRCRTCHLNMDKITSSGDLAFPHGHPSDLDDLTTWVEENKYPHPFTTHPRPELFTTAASPHPISTFGCTICHEGQGSGTDFQNAEHGPNDPHQQLEWHEEYGYHPNHFWEYPMAPERFYESNCIKCHHQVTDLGVNPEFGASAPKVVKGFNLIQKYGCFGCHEIHGTDGGEPIGPDLRLEPQTAEQAQRIAEDPKQNPGKYRKVGPSLRHVAEKTTAEFVAYWTEIPSRFRPSTKMPRFFQNFEHLLEEEQREETAAYESVELAGIAKVLIGDSEPLDLLKPSTDYQPDVKRGERLFRERGCLACHEHASVPGSKADFGPNISDIHRKINRNEDNKDFSDWLYTWLKEPTRYHKRTKMPNLYLDVYTEGEATVDPAADITAWLLSHGAKDEFPALSPDDEALTELVTLYLKKARYSDAAVKQILEERRFPEALEDVEGDERAFATEDGSAVADADEWRDRQLEYVGRRSLSRYGCYACHDISGYEDARPIGVALQDWGRKDTSKLGLEHIEEYLHHHGEPDGSSTLDRVDEALAMATDGSYSDEEMEPELTHAYFYNSLLHHGRAGFLWQKVRAPRSYDFKKTETKGYDERLRMPKFPLKEDEIEAIATFVLGLVADPPAEDYIYNPGIREKTRIEGEFLLAKYNCASCHMLDLPKFTFGVYEDNIFPTVLTASDHKDALPLLLDMRKPKNVFTGETGTFTVDGEEMQLPIASFHGMQMVAPDPDEDLEYQERTVVTWETIDFGEGEDAPRNLPASNISILESTMVGETPARGGDYAQWLVEDLMAASGKSDIAARSKAWGQVPPPLYQEGYKVQTAWLHEFLLNPETLRHATVLRMPKFNMSSEEAGVLANYFAAVDGVPFPYNDNFATSEEYLREREAQLTEAGLIAEDQQYLDQAWQTLNGLSDGLEQPTVLKNAKCVGCHSVAGLEYSPKPGDETPQGPDLRRVHRRLRPDWLKLWLFNPKWILPYTAMPNNFTADSKGNVPELLGGDPTAQVIGVRDALMNYNKLIEKHGIPVKGEPPATADPTEEAAATNESAEE